MRRSGHQQSRPPDPPPTPRPDPTPSGTSRKNRHPEHRYASDRTRARNDNQSSNALLIGAFRFNQSGTLTATGTLTVDSISAVLVGGTAVIGGRGSVWRTAVGALVVAAISDLLLLRGYSTPVQLLVLGLIVTTVVILSYVNSGQGRRA